jgi:hypothetical protein
MAPTCMRSSQTRLSLITMAQVCALSRKIAAGWGHVHSGLEQFGDFLIMLHP